MKLVLEIDEKKKKRHICETYPDIVKKENSVYSKYPYVQFGQELHET